MGGRKSQEQGAVGILYDVTSENKAFWEQNSRDAQGMQVELHDIVNI